MDKELQARLDKIKAEHNELLESIPKMESTDEASTALDGLESMFEKLQPLKSGASADDAMEEIEPSEPLPIPETDGLESDKGARNTQVDSSPPKTPSRDGEVSQPPQLEVPTADAYSRPRYSEWTRDGAKGLDLNDAVPGLKTGEKDTESDDIRTMEEIGHAAREYHWKLMQALTTIRDVLIEGVGDLEGVQAYFNRMR